MSESAPRIFVDADACPVKDEVLRVADRRGLGVWLVSNQWMQHPGGPDVQLIVVSKEPDAADDWIAEHARSGDVVVTADIPLAARCLEKQALVLGPTGRRLSDESIGNALAMRELHAELREAGEIKGYNATFTERDRSRFLQALERAVQSVSPSKPRGVG